MKIPTYPIFLANVTLQQIFFFWALCIKLGFFFFSLNENITRYDYNLTIMKSPKPAIDTIYPHIKF